MQIILASLSYGLSFKFGSRCNSTGTDMTFYLGHLIFFDGAKSNFCLFNGKYPFQECSFFFMGYSFPGSILSNAARMFTTHSRPMFTTDVRPMFTTHSRLMFTTDVRPVFTTRSRVGFTTGRSR